METQQTANELAALIDCEVWLTARGELVAVGSDKMREAIAASARIIYVARPKKEGN